jgi:hypothetical protein
MFRHVALLAPLALFGALDTSLAQDRGPCCDNPRACVLCEQTIQNGLCVASRCPQGLVPSAEASPTELRLHGLSPSLRDRIRELIAKEATSNGR